MDDEIYESMIENDEMWYMTGPDNAIIMYDLPLYDV